MPQVFVAQIDFIIAGSGKCMRINFRFVMPPHPWYGWLCCLGSVRFSGYNLISPINSACHECQKAGHFTISSTCAKEDSLYRDCGNVQSRVWNSWAHVLFCLNSIQRPFICIVTRVLLGSSPLDEMRALLGFGFGGVRENVLIVTQM